MKHDKQHMHHHVGKKMKGRKVKHHKATSLHKGENVAKDGLAHATHHQANMALGMGKGFAPDEHEFGDNPSHLGKNCEYHD
jgi:hypothetical protein